MSDTMSIDGIEGYLIGGDIPFLCRMAAQIPVGGSYLEIGSWMGLSAVTAAKELRRLGNGNAKVYCVDTWRGSTEHQNLDVIKKDELYDRFLANIARAGVSDMITPIRKPSVQAAQEWTGSSLDMVFVDGDHSNEACSNDILEWNKLLKVPSGIMFGHDGVGFVKEAIKEMAVKLSKKVTFYDPPVSHYMWIYE